MNADNSYDSKAREGTVLFLFKHPNIYSQLCIWNDCLVLLIVLPNCYLINRLLATRWALKALGNSIWLIVNGVLISYGFGLAITNQSTSQVWPPFCTIYLSFWSFLLCRHRELEILVLFTKAILLFANLLYLFYQHSYPFNSVSNISFYFFAW